MCYEHSVGLIILIVAQIYVYPIKSLRAAKVTEAVATSHGFKYDRKYSKRILRLFSTNMDRFVYDSAKDG
jgi:uncharacterized protein YcbX